MGLRSSTKSAIGFAELLVTAYFGYNFWASYQVDRAHFSPVTPGEVNIVAVKPGAGYRIVVANGIAQLAEVASTNFAAPDEMEAEEEGETTNRKRIPIKEMLQSLQGNEKALGKLVASLNGLKESDISATAPVWRAEAVLKALDGDKSLAAKLVADLNTELDGRPLPVVSRTALLDGVVLDLPVEVEVPVAGARKKLVGRILEPYQTQLMDTVWRSIREKPDIDDGIIRAAYLKRAQELQADPAQREDVRASLMARLSQQRLNRYSAAPARVLANAEVILNETYIEGAESVDRLESDAKPRYDLRIRLNDEGRRRLWKYSRGKTGFQLLLIVKGVAIAAPRISHELAQSTVTITMLPDKTLVEDAVAEMNGATLGGTKE